MKNANRCYVASPGLLALRANVPHVKWSYGINMPVASRVDYDGALFRLELNVRAHVHIPESTAMGKYHYYYAQPGGDSLFYKRDLFLGRKLEMEIAGLLRGTPRIVANRDYLRFIQYRFMNLHSVGYVLTDVVAWLLLQRGYAPVHCSAFVYNGKTVVVFAPPNTGKTLATMMMCLEHDARFIAEDIAITDGQVVYAVPWTSTFRYYPQVEKATWPRIVQRLTCTLPILELLPLVRRKTITAYVGESSVVERSVVDRIVILEHGESARLRLCEDEAIRRIANLNRYEFNYHKSPTMVAYEYFNPEVNLAQACEAEWTILARLVRSVEHCHLVRALRPALYSSLIKDLLS